MIWCDVGHVPLVTPILQLFSLLPSINWMGVALVIPKLTPSGSNKTEHFGYKGEWANEW